MSLSADGSTVAIGAIYNDGVNGRDSGHVRLYQRNIATNAWEQIGTDIDGEAAGDNSGWSVSLSADGSTVAIGGGVNWGGDDVGNVRLYQLNTTIDLKATFRNLEDEDGLIFEGGIEYQWEKLNDHISVWEPVEEQVSSLFEYLLDPDGSQEKLRVRATAEDKFGGVTEFISEAFIPFASSSVFPDRLDKISSESVLFGVN